MLAGSTDQGRDWRIAGKRNRGSRQRAVRMIGPILAAALLVPSAVSAEGPVVVTAGGELAGVQEDGVRVFRGVPYARPPIGELRWRAPAPAQPWSGRRDATRFAPSCPQAEAKPFGPYTAGFLPGPAFAEDCLYLNVWTAERGAAKRPVYVFVHGGGFVAGGSNVAIYDGAALARKGAVVVTINYRLGVLGFLAHPDLARESAARTSGNYALLDVIEALRWVRANAARFGGDPGNVTVAGQSAGAALVTDLLVSPPAAGLFHRAVIESGPDLGFPMPAYAAAEASGAAGVAKSGAEGIAGLRAMPADDVRGNVKAGFPLPVDDGKVVARGAAGAGSKLISQVPVIIGYTRDETSAAELPRTIAAFEAEVRRRFGALADRALALYPHATDAEAAASAVRIARDRRVAGMILWAEWRAAQGFPVYAYHFEHSLPGKDPAAFGAFHTAEVPYIFGAMPPGDVHFSPEDRALSETMQDRWLAFMKAGDPGMAHKGPRWRRATADPATIWRIGAADDKPLLDAGRLALFRAHSAAGGSLGLF